MATVKIDATNEANFKQKAWPVMPRGVYTFEVANEPHTEQAKSSTNNIIKVELKCLDEGEFKGLTIWDNIVLTPKAEFKLVHLVLAAGTQTREDMKNNDIDLSLLKGQAIRAEVSIEGPTQDRNDPSKTYPEKNRIQRYVFDEAKGVK